MFTLRLLVILLFPASLCAQLPAAATDTMYRFADYADVVYFPPSQASLSVEGPNVKMLTAFIDAADTSRLTGKPAGYLIWLVRGREFAKADFYLSPVPGWLIEYAGKKYRHRISDSGLQFLKQYAK
jgi:hypothetical protein